MRQYRLFKLFLLHSGSVDDDPADLGIVRSYVETNIEGSVRNSNIEFLHVGRINAIAAENEDVKDSRLDRSVFERNLKQTFTCGIVKVAATNDTKNMLGKVKPHPATPKPQRYLLMYAL
jgi:hypothetical protein